jgi:hypothetical protein
MERVMRIMLLSLLGAAAFKITYVTLYVDDEPPHELTIQQKIPPDVIE